MDEKRFVGGLLGAAPGGLSHAPGSLIFHPHSAMQAFPALQWFSESAFLCSRVCLSLDISLPGGVC